MAAGARTTTEARLQFEVLVERAEAAFARDPKAYTRRLLLLAALGYGYPFGVLAFTTTLTGALAYVALKRTALLLWLFKLKVGYLLPLVAFVLVRALWVRLEPPRGLRLDPAVHARLFALVRELGAGVGAPPVHEIVVVEAFNAAIQQTPRLGVFGWYRNTLILGLPLLLGLTRDQFRAVLAHEFGHLTGNHSRFNGWIYRVRLAWMRIMAAFDREGGWAHAVFGHFFDWYAPYFNAYSFALGRVNEYEADRLSASVTNPETLAAALIQSSILPELLERHYWSGVRAQAVVTADVNPHVWSGLARFLETHTFAEADRMAVLDRHLREATGHADTHPALRDRLGGAAATPPPPARSSAAAELFGAGLPALLREFDAIWAKDNAGPWRERHAAMSEGRRELARLESLRGERALEPEELWKLAAWTEELRPESDPVPLYLDCLARDPHSANASFALGRVLLGRGDPAGLPHLERAMGNRQAVIPACEIAYAFHMGRNEDAAAEAYRRRAEQQMDLERRAGRERSTLSPRDTFLDAGLDDAWIVSMRQRLQGIPGIRRVWVCRKAVEALPEEPCHVVIFEPRWHARATATGRAIGDVLHMPGAYIVVGTRGENSRIARKALRVATRVL